MYNIKQIKEHLKNNLSDRRYEHSLLVAMEAKKLANIYNVDAKDAYVAGLLHDIAKEFSVDLNDYYINKYNISNDIIKEEYKNILHAEIGYYVVKELYNFNLNICLAVKYHAVGNQDMNMLAKIILIADKIGRKKITPTLENLRILAYQDIDKAIIFYLENLKEKLENKGNIFHPDSVKLLKKLVKNKSSQN